MYLILIGYLYVIVMYAAASGSVARGVSIVLFLGLLPSLLFLRLLKRRQRPAHHDEGAAAGSVREDRAAEPDRGHAGGDQ